MKLVDRSRQEGHSRGERFGGIAASRLDDLDPLRRGQRRVLGIDEMEGVERGHEPRVDRRRKRVGGENEPVKPAVKRMAPSRKLHCWPWATAVAASRPAILLGFDRRRLDAVDPARPDRARHRSGFRDRDAVEAQGLAAGFANADQGRRLVVEGEAVRRVEGEAEFWMNEGVVAHDALRRVVAEGKAVDGGEIAVAIDVAVPGAPNFRASSVAWAMRSGVEGWVAIMSGRSADPAPEQKREARSTRQAR